jgi:glycosyltransferase involved in cell wall biosynthesis
MNILHAAYSLDDSSAATRLAVAQENNGANIFFLIGRKSGSAFVSKHQQLPLLSNFVGLIYHVFEYFFQKSYLKTKNEIYSFGLNNWLTFLLVSSIIKNKKIKVLHLHWGGYSFLSQQVLYSIKKKYPSLKVIITSHDYYYFTGGCHLPMDCKNLVLGCPDCPMIKTSNKANWIYKRREAKKKMVEAVAPTVISPSTYSRNTISRLFPTLPITVIPNVLPKIFFDFDLNDQSYFENYLNFRRASRNAPTIIIVGMKNSERQNKGSDIIRHVFEKLVNAQIESKVITVGEYVDLPEIGTRFHYDSLNAEELIRLYRISDLCLVPSRYETFSQVTLESLILGTPVVAFDLTGPRDLISDRENGFLCPPFEVDQYAKIVSEQLDFKCNNLESLLLKMREIRQLYSPEILADKHLNLYSDGC